MTVTITLNGRKITEDIAPDTILLDFIRAHGAKSVKRGCDTSNCGLCTVFLDDKPVLSCSVLAARADQIAAGDVIQLQNSSGDFYHTLIISGFTDSDVLVCAQSNDALDRPLSSYNYAGLRVIHIEGGRLNVDTDASFNGIFNGESIISL